MILNKFCVCNRLVASGILAFALMSSSKQVSQAASVELRPSSCVVGGGGHVYETDEEVSVGREVLSTSFMMRFYGVDSYASPLITCKLRSANSPPKFKTLKLEFGVRDDASSEFGRNPTEIVIYTDGNQITSREVTVGEKATVLIDVSKNRSVAIEANCSKAPCPGVRFFKSSLDLINSSPGKRN